MDFAYCMTIKSEFNYPCCHSFSSNFQNIFYIYDSIYFFFLPSKKVNLVAFTPLFKTPQWTLITFHIKVELHPMAHRTFYDGAPLLELPTISSLFLCTLSSRHRIDLQYICLQICLQFLIEYLAPKSHSIHSYWVQEHTVWICEIADCRDENFNWKRSCVEGFRIKKEHLKSQGYTIQGFVSNSCCPKEI